MQVAIVPVQICTGTVACAYNFLTIFSLSSLYLTLSSLSLSRRTTLSFFLSSNQSFFLSSIFLPLASVDRHRRRRSPLPPPIALYSFVSRCFRVEWAFDQWVSGWMSLAIAIATACLWRRRSCFSFSPSPPEASILLLKARRRFRVGGVDCVVGFVLIPGCWIVLLGCVDSGLLGLFFWFVFLVCWVCCRWIVWIPVWYRCGSVAV